MDYDLLGFLQFIQQNRWISRSKASSTAVRAQHQSRSWISKGTDRASSRSTKSTGICSSELTWARYISCKNSIRRSLAHTLIRVKAL